MNGSSGRSGRAVPTLTMSGLAGVELTTRLLQRARLAHPTAGVWEAADVQWWWRQERPTDSVDQAYWLDDEGEPAGAVTFTAWARSWQCDVVSVPGRADLLTSMWAHAVEAIDAMSLDDVEVPVDDEDDTLIELVQGSGFVASDGHGAATWMAASDRPAVTSLPHGYRLRDRVDASTEQHHMVPRGGEHIAVRLAETSLYRPDLDLFVETLDGEVAGYALFWLDTVTSVGFLEPMRTEAGHERKGIARHMLTTGLDRLAAAGATRLKVNHEAGNDRAERLYTSAGFVAESTVTVYVPGQAG